MTQPNAADRMTGRKIALRTLLVIPFALQLFTAVTLVGWLSIRNGQESVDDVADQLRSEIDARIHEYLSDLLDVPHLINRSNLDAIALGAIDTKASEDLGQYFWRQLNRFDPVSFIFFASYEGGAAGVGRRGGTVILDVTSVAQDGTLIVSAWGTTPLQTQVAFPSPAWVLS